jgi:predicted ABC-type ATPase
MSDDSLTRAGSKPKLPEELDLEQLDKYFVLSAADLAEIQECRGATNKIGFAIQLCSLANPEEAIARVAARVAQGGHYVPDDVVRRRFVAGLQNFQMIYRAEVNFWRWYDNSGDTPILISKGENL